MRRHLHCSSFVAVDFTGGHDAGNGLHQWTGELSDIELNQTAQSSHQSSTHKCTRLEVCQAFLTMLGSRSGQQKALSWLHNALCSARGLIDGNGPRRTCLACPGPVPSHAQNTALEALNIKQHCSQNAATTTHQHSSSGSCWTRSTSFIVSLTFEARSKSGCSDVSMLLAFCAEYQWQMVPETCSRQCDQSG